MKSYKAAATGENKILNICFSFESLAPLAISFLTMANLKNKQIVDKLVKMKEFTSIFNFLQERMLTPAIQPPVFTIGIKRKRKE